METIGSIKVDKDIDAAHGNTLRVPSSSIWTIFLPMNTITELNILPESPPGLNWMKTSNPFRNKDAIVPLKGRYLGDLEQVKRIGAVVRKPNN
jgi:hypothetical protein